MLHFLLLSPPSPATNPLKLYNKILLIILTVLIEDYEKY